MATSGTTDFNLSIDDAIEEAYERCGLQTRTGYDLTSSRRVLNIMFAEWANRGINIWTIKQRTATLAADDQSNTNDFATDIVDVLDVVVRDGTTDFTVNKISRAEYLNTPVKSTTGRPNQFFFDGQIDPKMFFYPAADKAYTVVYNALTRIQDAGAYTNTTDLPFRFYPCLVAGLAYYIAMKRAPERMADLKFEYEDVWKRAADQDGNRDSVFLTPQNYFVGT
jgi:hypothetical protein|tara:strand:+ start:233 stop:901 length:669 start_codon:yes stop_codon:yes gene_type:complete